MRYLTTIPLKLKTPDGILDLQPGDTFRPDSPDAVKSLLAEGKLKPFCYWLKSVIDDCQMPCFEIEAKVVNYECPHFREYWNERLKKNTGELTK